MDNNNKSSFDEDVEYTMHRGQFPLPWLIISLCIFALIIKFNLIWLIAVIMGAAVVISIIVLIISLRSKDDAEPAKFLPPRSFDDYDRQMKEENDEDN